MSAEIGFLYLWMAFDILWFVITAGSLGHHVTVRS
jgi:hypothetical protein